MAEDSRSKWREAQGLKFLLGDSARPEYCGPHSHEKPLVCMLLRGGIQEIDARGRAVERGTHSVNVTPTGDSHIHQIITDRLTTLCFLIDKPFEEILGEDARLFDLQ